MKDLAKMTEEELKGLLKQINAELANRTTQDNKVMLILLDEMKKVAKYDIDRYNGGWTKKIESLDKSKTNGYSLLGDFVNGTTHKNYYKKGSLFVDCDIEGSRSHHEKFYQLFYLNQNGDMELLAADKTADYAVNFWEEIEKHL